MIRHSSLLQSRLSVPFLGMLGFLFTIGGIVRFPLALFRRRRNVSRGNHRDGSQTIVPRKRCSAWLTSCRGNVLVTAALICGFNCVADVRLSTAQGTPSREPLKGVDLAGRLFRFGEQGDSTAVVVCFLSTQCPISNGYLPVLDEMSTKYRRLGVEFYGVISDPSVTLRRGVGVSFEIPHSLSDLV